ncbi:hypothetical protein SDC9_136983 [bioreactor metagenome]|uniref:Uncharacterized protein n=1 Tax=bioreactor metagenome TaxID=1076179 RepID=A0A645DLB2_9ZZZZ
MQYALDCAKEVAVSRQCRAVRAVGDRSHACRSGDAQRFGVGAATTQRGAIQLNSECLGNGGGQGLRQVRRVGQQFTADLEQECQRLRHRLHCAERGFRVRHVARFETPCGFGDGVHGHSGEHLCARVQRHDASASTQHRRSRHKGFQDAGHHDRGQCESASGIGSSRQGCAYCLSAVHACHAAHEVIECERRATVAVNAILGRVVAANVSSRVQCFQGRAVAVFPAAATQRGCSVFVTCALIHFIRMLNLASNALSLGEHLIDTVSNVSRHLARVLLHQGVDLCDLLVVFMAKFCEFGHGEFQ